VTKCTGSKEFRDCHNEAVTTTDEVCGEGDTFDAAKVDLAAELKQLEKGAIGVVVGKSQSATQFTSFLEFVKGIALKCTTGEM